jgi:hypothetical protein
LIPERVEAVTSITLGRGRRFFTPVGLFIYRRVSLKAYSVGIDQVELPGGRNFLMATPEKALADKIQDDRGAGICTRAEMKEYLLTNLRIDTGGLEKMDASLLGQIAAGYGSRKIRLLGDLLRISPE